MTLADLVRLVSCRLLPLVWGLGSMLLLGSNCGPAPLERCTQDADCQATSPYLRCEVESGLCLCSDDRGCGPNETCNAVGRCQANSGCASNADCCDGEAVCDNFFCDVTTAQCLSVLECQPDEGELCCTLDSQCPFAHVCNTFDQRCIPGCRNDGDCILGDGCVGASLTGGLGQCEAGKCTANNQCGYGELCNLETGSCVFDSRGPYCAGCSGGASSDDCGDPANYCLVNTNDPTRQSEYCGVDCSQGQPCPFGYSCNNVRIVPSTESCIAPETCDRDDPADPSGVCSRHPGQTCTIAEDCPEGSPGSNCPRAEVGNCLLDQTRACAQDAECCDDPSACPEGSCVKQVCLGGEGDSFGYCSCTRDLDCPRDECTGADLSDPASPVPGYCRVSGHRCYEDIDCDVIACVNGGCLIGKNCAPANDRSCADIGAE